MRGSLPLFVAIDSLKEAANGGCFDCEGVKDARSMSSTVCKMQEIRNTHYFVEVQRLKCASCVAVVVVPAG